MLWGLFFVLIPIILHLFNFRRFKTVYFSNVDLLKEIKEESKKSRTLKNWLILLFRILFITFLVLAFAFPISGDQKIEEDKIIGIYIDNSFSMDADGIEGNKLDNAKAYADQIISNLPPNTKIHITTNDFKGDHQMAYSKSKAQQEISKILPSPKSRDIKDIYNRQSLFFENSPQTNLYWISDFQQLDDTSFKNIKNFKIQLGLLESIEDANISIDSVWFENPIRKKMGNEKLSFKITNHGKNIIKDFNVSLRINERLTNLNLAELPNGSSIHQVDFQVPNNSLIKGKLSIEDGFQSFDNKLAFSYLIPQQQKVYLIAGKESKTRSIVNRIFKADSSIQINSRTPLSIEYGELDACDLIILGELNSIPQTLINKLQNLSKAGKTIAVIPGVKIDKDSYDDASLFWGNIKYGTLDTTNVEIGSISKKNDFFSGVFDKQKIKENIKESFPKLYSSYPLSSTANSTVLIFKEDGSPYLIKNRGFYLFSSGITKTQSNISQKAIIVPIFYQMLFNSVNITPIQYFIKPVTEIETPATNQKTLELTQNQFKTQIRVSENKAHLPNDLSVGDYQLKSDKKIISAFSVNYSRSESKTIQKQLELLDQLEQKDEFSRIEISGNKNDNISKIVDEAGSLWLTCLIIALGFLTLEMIFIRIKVG